MLVPYILRTTCPVQSIHPPVSRPCRTTLGVVSALLLGVSYSNSLVAPPTVDSEDVLVVWAVRVVTVSGGLSLVLSIYIITFTVSLLRHSSRLVLSPLKTVFLKKKFVILVVYRRPWHTVPQLCLSVNHTKNVGMCIIGIMNI